MTRTEFEKYITDIYSTQGEQPWVQYPRYTVFRHSKNRKWFAVIMDLPGEKLGISGTETISVVNVKCDSRLITSFRQESGIFPGYHMNKAHWLTCGLDMVEDEKLKFLLNMSYELTK